MGTELMSTAYFGVENGYAGRMHGGGQRRSRSQNSSSLDSRSSDSPRRSGSTPRPDNPHFNTLDDQNSTVLGHNGSAGGESWMLSQFPRLDDSAGGSLRSPSHSQQHYPPRGAGTVGTGNGLFKHLRAHNKLPPSLHVMNVFQALKNGLRSHAEATEREIELARSSAESACVDSAQGRLFDLEKHLKSCERYLKRLEFQISRVEELQEKYDIQLRLHEGAQNLASAYSQRRRLGSDALNSVREDIKDLNQTVDTMEAELDLLLGTFELQIKGIVGFARVTPGDVFEVCLRHGFQKWKSRGKTGSDRKQKWDSEKTTFKCLKDQPLEIKVSEIKFFGKNAVLADQSCSPMELFSADPQLLTMNLNIHGSIKLNIVLTWNPLDRYLSPQEPSLSQSFGKGRMGGSPQVGQRSLSSPASKRPVSVYYPMATETNNKTPSPLVSKEMNGKVSSMSTPSPRKQYPEMQQLCSGMSFEDLAGHNKRRGSPPPVVPPLLALIRSLKPLLHKLQQLHPPLVPLEDFILQWDALLKKKLLGGNSLNSRKHKSASHGLNLGAHQFDGAYQLDENYIMRTSSSGTQDSRDSGFDSFPTKRSTSSPYLNGIGSNHKWHSSTVELHKSSMPETRSPQGSYNMNGMRKEIPRAWAHRNDLESQPAQTVLSPSQRKTRKMAERSGGRRKSMGNTLDDPNFSMMETEESGSLDKGCASSGSPELDHSLHHHLLRVQLLLKSLNAHYGPLEYRQNEYLHDLSVESRVLETLLNIAKGRIPLHIQQLFEWLGCSDETRKLWTGITENMPTKLLAPAHAIRQALLKEYGHIVRGRYPDLVAPAFDKILNLFTSGGVWNPDTITLFQFCNSLHDKELNTFVESIAHETWIISSLSTRVAATVSQVTERLKRVPVSPPLPCLRSMALLLVDPLKDLYPPIESYLLQSEGKLRSDLVLAFLSFLEDDDSSVRRGSCRILSIIAQPKSCLGALCFVARCDKKGIVREEARRAALSFGYEGRQILTASSDEGELF